MLSPFRSFVILVLVSAVCVGESAPDKKPANLDYGSEAYVIERSSSDLKIEDDGSYVRTDSVRVRIQSDAGVQHYGLLTFPYEKATGKVEIDYVRARKPDGTVVNTPDGDIQEMASDITRQAPFYSDLYEKHVPVKGLSTGDILEYQAHWTITKPLAPGQFWFAFSFDHDDIVLDQQLKVSVPKARTIKFSSGANQPEITTVGEYQTYLWKSANLSSKNGEQRKETEQSRLIDLARGQTPPPDVLLSSFQSWEQVGKWFSDLQAEQLKATAEVRAKALQLTKDAKSDHEKIEAIYNFVSLQNRYIGIALGIGRYQPHSAADVLENGYGDCKDKETLLASLLDAIGIKAYPALVNASGVVDPNVPSPGQFNHVVAVIPDANSWIWADTTPEVAPLGYLMSTLRGKQALVIPQTGTPSLMETPRESSGKNLSTFHLAGKIDQAGTLDAMIHWEYQGNDDAIVLRSAFRLTAESQRKEVVQRLSYASGFSGDVSDDKISAAQDLDAPFTLSYKYLRKDFPQWTSGQIDSPLPPFALPPVVKDDDYPQRPIWLRDPRTEVLHSEIEVPQGEVITPQKGVGVVYDFAEYHSTYKFSGGKIISDRTLLVKLNEVPLKEREDYKKFYKIISDDYQSMAAVGLRGSNSVTAEPVADTFGPGSAAIKFQQAMQSLPPSMNPEAVDLFNEAQEAATQHDLPTAIDDLKKVVATDPGCARAWIMLGLLSFYDKDTAAAEHSFHQAVSNNPKNPDVFRAVALAFIAINKRHDALSVYQDMLKIAPDDFDALESLGVGLYVEKRYSEALPVLESALRIKPDDVGINRTLGSTYLSLNQDDKAVIAFKKAVDADPEAESLNDGAYDLADANKQLPLALDWARKAVHEEELKSASANLATLDKNDLYRISTLAAYWDTLGWAYYRLNEPVEAEKYLRAAWLLSPNDIVAGHVDAVYKTEHKTFKSDQDAKNQARTVSLKGLKPTEGSAEFFLLFTRDPKTGVATVEDVKFIRGPDALKSADKILEKTKYDVEFPDDGPTKLVRRGILGCYKYTGCSFVMLLPDTVKSVN
jgi:tetratricopeptide (TPR) repeat protein